MQQHTADTWGTIAAKTSPPVITLGATLFGIPVPNIAQWLTAIYLALMIAHKIWHMVKEYRSGRQFPVSEDTLP
ncbi:MAG: hypothetical protein JO269_09725 [Burkholderiaceae bacterium]|nr:hypothetical protein [Burkholderiaceae bacterium]